MSGHRIRIQGASASAERISGYVYRDLLDVLVEGAERALRYQLEGRSTGRGTAPRWLRPAAAFDLVRPPNLGMNEAEVEARPLLASMADRFHQADLFLDFDPQKSPIDLFEDALEDALRGNADSDKFDAGLIKTFEKLGALLDEGVEQIQWINGRTVTFDRRGLEAIHTLERASYPPQRVRVAGRLEAIRYSDCRFTLEVAPGTLLQGTAVNLGQETLQKHFGQPVVVTGRASFRPSGKPLRLEAERLDAASPRELELWAEPPKPLMPPGPTTWTLRDEARGKVGLSALLGKWPGDESDEEVLAALENLS